MVDLWVVDKRNEYSILNRAVEEMMVVIKEMKMASQSTFR